MEQFSKFSDNYDFEYLNNDNILKDTLTSINNSEETNFIIRKNKKNEYYLDLCEHNLKLQKYSIISKNSVLAYELNITKIDNNEELYVNICNLSKNTFTNNIVIKSEGKIVGEFMVKKSEILKNPTIMNGYIFYNTEKIFLKTNQNEKYKYDKFSTKNVNLYFRRRNSKIWNRVFEIYKNGSNFISINYKSPLNLLYSFVLGMIIII